MHNLHRNKIILTFSFFLLVTASIWSQARPSSNMNYWDFRKKPFYFGLTIGMHSTGYVTSKSSEFTGSNIKFVAGDSRPGLNVNIITNLKIGNYFDFRFIPGFAFSERKFLIEPKDPLLDDIIQDIRIESVFLEIPLLLRYKSDPYKDKRLFVVGGLKYSYDVSSTSSTRKEQAANLLKIAPHDFQFEIGAGMQFFFPFFIFSPEIKFSRGLNNINIFNGELESSRVIDKILSRAFTISLHFEG